MALPTAQQGQAKGEGLLGVDVCVPALDPQQAGFAVPVVPSLSPGCRWGGRAWPCAARVPAFGTACCCSRCPPAKLST